MRIATLVSPDDWMFNYGTSGKVGWRHVIERCARAGITRIYWRVTTGWSYYASKINNTGPVYDEYAIRQITRFKRWAYYECVDWSRDDTLAAATEHARRLGIELYAWLTIENSHGIGSRTRLAQEHPEMMTVDRRGKPYWRIAGWAFPEVRRWWLDIVREVVAYNPAGILLDIGRLGYSTDPLITGTSSGGYEKPMVEAFVQETGRDPFEIPNDDPQWISFRARFFTHWVEQVHALFSAQPKPIEFSALMLPPGAFRVHSPTNTFAEPALREDKAPSKDIVATVAVSPLKYRFADLETWSQKNWISQVSLVDFFPASDPTQWEFVESDNPYAIDFEPHHSKGEAFGRLATIDERRKAMAYFSDLSNGGLACSWCVNPQHFQDPQELQKYMVSLKDEGFAEANIDESNLLMDEKKDRWDAVAKASKQISG